MSDIITMKRFFFNEGSKPYTLFCIPLVKTEPEGDKFEMEIILTGHSVGTVRVVDTFDSSPHLRRAFDSINRGFAENTANDLIKQYEVVNSLNAEKT